MAEKVDSEDNSQSSSQNLTCPLCLDIFCEATLLTCGHTFCRKCLKTFDLSNPDLGHIVCPLCRKITKLTVNRVDDLPANVSVNGLVDNYHEEHGGGNSVFEMSPKCTTCNFQADAVSFCRTCDTCMCDEFLHSHEIVSIQDIIENRISIEQSSEKCSKHIHEDKDLFCEGCSVHVCHKCVIAGHRDHKIKNQDDFVKELQLKVNDLIKRCTPKKSELEKNIHKLEGYRQEVLTTMQKLRTGVQEACTTKTKRLEENKQSLLENIDALQSAFNEDLDALKSSDLQKIKSICSSLTLVANDRLGHLETDSLSAHALLCEELDGMLKKATDNTSAADITKKAQKIRFQRAEDTRLDLGKISVQDPKPTRGNMLNGTTNKTDDISAPEATIMTKKPQEMMFQPADETCLDLRNVSEPDPKPARCNMLKGSNDKTNDTSERVPTINMRKKALMKRFQPTYGNRLNLGNVSEPDPKPARDSMLKGSNDKTDDTSARAFNIMTNKPQEMMFQPADDNRLDLGNISNQDPKYARSSMLNGTTDKTDDTPAPVSTIMTKKPQKILRFQPADETCLDLKNVSEPDPKPATGSILNGTTNKNDGTSAPAATIMTKKPHIIPRFQPADETRLNLGNVSEPDPKPARCNMLKGSNDKTNDTSERVPTINMKKKALMKRFQPTYGTRLNLGNVSEPDPKPARDSILKGSNDKTDDTSARAFNIMTNKPQEMMFQPADDTRLDLGNISNQDPKYARSSMLNGTTDKTDDTSARAFNIMTNKPQEMMFQPADETCLDLRNVSEPDPKPATGSILNGTTNKNDGTSAPAATIMTKKPHIIPRFQPADETRLDLRNVSEPDPTPVRGSMLLGTNDKTNDTSERVPTINMRKKALMKRFQPTDGTRLNLGNVSEPDPKPAMDSMLKGSNDKTDDTSARACNIMTNRPQKKLFQPADNTRLELGNVSVSDNKLARSSMLNGTTDKTDNTSAPAVTIMSKKPQIIPRVQPADETCLDLRNVSEADPKPARGSMLNGTTDKTDDTSAPVSTIMTKKPQKILRFQPADETCLGLRNVSEPDPKPATGSILNGTTNKNDGTSAPAATIMTKKPQIIPRSNDTSERVPTINMRMKALMKRFQPTDGTCLNLGNVSEPDPKPARGSMLKGSNGKTDDTSARACNIMTNKPQNKLFQPADNTCLELGNVSVSGNKLARSSMLNGTADNTDDTSERVPTINIRKKALMKRFQPTDGRPTRLNLGNVTEPDPKIARSSIFRSQGTTNMTDDAYVRAPTINMIKKPQKTRFQPADKTPLYPGYISEPHPKLKVIKCVNLRGKSHGLAKYSAVSVAVGYCCKATLGIDIIDSSGNNHLYGNIPSDIQCYDLAFQKDKTLCTSTSTTDVHIYSPKGSRMLEIHRTSPGYPTLNITPTDEILVANGDSEIRIYDKTGSTVKYSVPITRNSITCQASSTSTDLIVTSSCQANPSIVTVYDRSGNAGKPLQAPSGVCLYAAVDKHDRVYVASVDQKAGQVVIRLYDIDGLNLKERVEFNPLNLKLTLEWCYLVSLTPKLLAFACSRKLYFINVSL